MNELDLGRIWPELGVNQRIKALRTLWVRVQAVHHWKRKELALTRQA
jgi:hypothetical protein